MMESEEGEKATMPLEEREKAVMPSGKQEEESALSKDMTVGTIEAEEKKKTNEIPEEGEKVITPPEEVTTDMMEAEEKQKAQAKENARRAQLVYPTQEKHEDPRKKQKKLHFTGFGRKLTKFMSFLLLVLFVGLLGLVIYKIMNVNYVAADKFILIGAQPNMVLESETYVFNDYKEYIKKTMGAGGLTEEDFSSAKYGLVSIPYENCGEAEEVVEVQGANTEGNVVKVKVLEKATCEGAGTMYVNYLFPINKDIAEPTLEIEFVDEGNSGSGNNSNENSSGSENGSGGSNDEDETVQGGGEVDVQEVIEKVYTGR